MVRLYVGLNHLSIVLHDEFLVFKNTKENDSWEFQKVVKCNGESLKSNNVGIECCNFSPCGNYFGVSFDKNIIVYSTVKWDVLFVAPGERRASCLNFFSKSNILLAANKSGSALFYSFDKDKLEKLEGSLGHNSMLTNALITTNEKFVITCDRDEKIRVSNYPNVYNIERFCLGHTQFVSWIDFLPSDKRILVSCSGDGTLRFWDFMSGKELTVYDCNESSENSTPVIVKVALCEIKSVSILAVVEYKSSQVRILKVTGNLSEISVELITTLQLPSVPWDIVFCNEHLICLLPNKDQPLIIWSASHNVLEENHSFQVIKKYLSENFSLILNASNKISDDIPVLFKREVDNIQEYEQRKKARLLRTGKTS